MQQFRRLRLNRRAGRRPAWLAEVYDQEAARYRDVRLFTSSDHRFLDPGQADETLRDAWRRVAAHKRPTKAQATLRASEYYKELNEASWGPKVRQDLHGLVELDMSQRMGRRGQPRSVRTMNDNGRVLGSFARFLKCRYPRLPLQKLDSPHIEDYLAKRTDDGVSYGTRRRELATIRSMFSLGVKRGWIRFNPCVRVQMSAPSLANEREARRRHAISEIELQAILQSCRAPYEQRVSMQRRGRPVQYVEEKQPPAHLFAFVLVAARCGPRRGELLQTLVKDERTGEIHTYPGLRWEDIDWRSHRFRVSGKTGPRMVPMSNEVEQVLRDLRRHQVSQGHADGHVFLDEHGRPVENPRRAFQSAVRRAGIDRHVRLHDLRHTALTRLAESGVSPSVIQRIAGHSSLQVTSLYVNPDDDHVVAEFRKAHGS